MEFLHFYLSHFDTQRFRVGECKLLFAVVPSVVSGAFKYIILLYPNLVK